MSLGIDNLNKINQEIKALNGTITQDQQEVNFFSKNSAGAGDTVKFSTEAKANADSAVTDGKASLGALKGSLDSADMAYNAAKLKLENDPDNKELQQTVNSKKEAYEKIQQQIKEVEGNVEDATKTQEKATTELATATESKTSADETLKNSETTLDGDKTKMIGLESEKSAVETQIETEEKDTNDVKTGGTVTTTTTSESGMLTKTSTVTENSKEFKAQEQENFLNAQEIGKKHKGENSLDIENSLDDETRSARVEQTKSLATVDYVPELTTTIAQATVFEDSVAAANNDASAATAVIRNKDAAVAYYFEKQGITNPTVSDRYEAEYAVSALQPEIIANAKSAVEYKAKFTDATATQEERDKAVEMLKNGAIFEDTGEKRTASEPLVNTKRELLNASEKEALIAKIQSGSTDYSDRELNALTYLQGSTDHQGFPTVPKDMVWKLPAEFKKEDQLFNGEAETYVCNFASNGDYGNTVKVLVAPDSDAHKIFAQGLSQQHEDSIMGAENLSTGGDNSYRNPTLIEAEKSAYSNGDVTWKQLVDVAGKDGKLSAKDLVAAGYMDEKVLDTLKNPDQEYEIHDMGDMSAVYSIEKMTDGDSKTGRTTIHEGRAAKIEENDGYVISGRNDLNTQSLGSVKTGKTSVAEFSYYVSDAKGNPVIKTVTVSSTDAQNGLANLKKVAQENYQKFKAEGKL